MHPWYLLKQFESGLDFNSASKLKERRNTFADVDRADSVGVKSFRDAGQMVRIKDPSWFEPNIPDAPIRISLTNLWYIFILLFLISSVSHASLLCLDSELFANRWAIM